MDCAAIAHDLSRFADGELEGEAADRVAAHMAGCERCRARLEETELAFGGGRRIPAPPQAPPVRPEEWRERWSAIETAISATFVDERRARKAARLVRVLIPLAAAALLLLGAYAGQVFLEHVHGHPGSESLDTGTQLVFLGPGGE